ncbi:hypothetical protein TrST_g1486 [Triparma strigata]|uniref:Exonuclease 1 n=1 Tax=Triparma strigata TaxID=1606541 RepID=A0A9W7AM78_9STRA|nr:hypothetical protein TrST_g1486 [Triparma strigata]
MGIPKLWPRLNPIMERAHLSDFKGKRVALDFSIMVHTATHAFALQKQNNALSTNFGKMVEREKTAEEREQDEKNREEQFIKQCTLSIVNKVLAMIQEGIELLIVLDGTTPPLKRETTAKRKADMAEARDYMDATDFNPESGPTAPEPDAPAAPLPSFDDPDIDYDAIELDNPIKDNTTSEGMTESNHAEPAPIFQHFKKSDEAKKRFQAARKAGATSAEFQIIYGNLLSAFRAQNIPFMVSPYESDAQLAFLANTKVQSKTTQKLEPLVHLVISSDSDCVPHGIPQILSKTDASNHGELYLKTDLCNLPADFALADFSDGMMVCFCILAGCDYLSNLDQLGIVKAHQFVTTAFHEYHNSLEPKETLTPPLKKLFDSLRATTMMKKLPLYEQELYLNNFLRSLVMFRHPVIFSQISGEQEIMDREDDDLLAYEPYEKMVTDDEIVQSICGEIVEPAIAQGMSMGWINARTLHLVEGSRGEKPPEDLKTEYEEWVAGGGIEELDEMRQRRRDEREAELQKMKEECDAIEEEKLKGARLKEEKLKEEKRRKKRKQKGATRLEEMYRERFEALYSKYAPKKVKKISSVMAKYKDNLAEALAAAEEKYAGEAGPPIVSDYPDKVSLSPRMKSPKKRAAASTPKVRARDVQKETQESAQSTQSNVSSAGDDRPLNAMELRLLEAVEKKTQAIGERARNQAREEKERCKESSLEETEDEAEESPAAGKELAEALQFKKVSQHISKPKKRSGQHPVAKDIEKENTPEDENLSEPAPNSPAPNSPAHSASLKESEDFLSPLQTTSRIAAPGWSTRAPDEGRKREMNIDDDGWFESSSDEGDIADIRPLVLPDVDGEEEGSGKGGGSDSDSDSSDPARFLGEKGTKVVARKKTKAKMSSKAPATTLKGWTNKAETTKLRYHKPVQPGRPGWNNSIWTSEAKSCMTKGIEKYAPDGILQKKKSGPLRQIKNDPEFAHELRNFDISQMRSWWRNQERKKERDSKPLTKAQQLQLRKKW